jgi:hypothetical protein
MQYEVTLPADYDIGTIRTRVAGRGHLLDDRTGLGLKAYAIRERGVDGSPRYRVAHLSAPGLAGVPAGRHW